MLWTQRHALLTSLLRGAASERGVHELELEVVAFDSGGLRIENVRWPPLLAVESIVVESHLAGLLRGRADGVVVEGLRVRIEGDEQLATLEAALGGGTGPKGGAGPPLTAVPDRIVVRDARATAELGPLRADLRVDADLVRGDPSGPWRGDLDAELRADPIHVTAKLDASAGTGRIGGQGPVEVELDGSLDPFGLEGVRVDGLRGQGRLVLVAEGGVPGAWLEMAATPFSGRLSGVDVAGTLPALDIQLEPGEAEPLVIEARGGSLARQGEPGRLEALAFDAEGSMAAFELRATARVVDGRVAEAALPLTTARATLARQAGQDRLALEIEIDGVAAPLRLDAVRTADALTFRARPFDVGPGGLGPIALASGLLPGVESLGGRAEIRRGGLDPETGTVRFDLVLDDVSAGSAAGVASGIGGSVAVTGPRPWRTAGPQALTLASLQAGLPFEDGRLVFEVGPEGAARVTELELRVAGGKARAEGPFLVDPADTRVAFEVEDVDLGALLAEIAIDGLSGDGTLRGRLPFEWNGERARLHRGLLEATGPGVVSYEAPLALAAEPPGGNDLGVLIEVLEDFRYDVLRVEAHGDLLGTVQLVLHTEGHNPSFQDGRPIDFTLNLEAPFSDLLGSTRWLTGPPVDVEELLKALPPTPGTPSSRGGDG